MIVREGQILNGTYRLVRLIGEGGMGRVFEATHARLAGRYAIKVLLHKLSSNAEVLRRFDREARITSSLQHPNIVQVIDFNTAADGTEFLVMEYLPGESVAARLYREGPQSLETVVDIVDQVAAGLSAAHAHGIVHRDLKPDNIFLVPVEGKATAWAKILDFGISKMRGADPAVTGPVSAMLGTPLYMAPEQCQGRTGEVNAATDQFALAAITYEMLTGRSPFAGETVGEVLTHVIHDDPPMMGIDSNVEAVVRRGLSKVNANRFPSVVNFAEALRAAAALRPSELGEGGTDAYTVGEVAHAGRRGGGPRRNWGVLVPAAAAIALVSAFIVREARNGAAETEVRGPVAPSMVPVSPRAIGPHVTRQPPLLPSPPTPTAQPVGPEGRVADTTPPSLRPATEPAGESSVPPARLASARRENGGLVTSKRGDSTTRRERSLALARAAAAAPATVGEATTARHEAARKARALDLGGNLAGNVPSERLRASAAPLADEDATLPLDDAIDDRPARPSMTPGVVERRTAN